jgi:acyl transferase domain-containing protein
MDPILDEFEKVAKSISYGPAKVPLISAMTGKLTTKKDKNETPIESAKYWSNHIHQAVLFDASMQTLFNMKFACFLEVGPAPVLSALGRRIAADESMSWISSLQGASASEEWQSTCLALGSFFTRNGEINWNEVFDSKVCTKQRLPTYRFQRQRFWVTPKEGGHMLEPLANMPIKNELFEPNMYETEWQPSFLPQRGNGDGLWVLLSDSVFGPKLALQLRNAGGTVVIVRAGPKGSELTENTSGTFVMDPLNPEQYKKLLQKVASDHDTSLTSGGDASGIRGVVHGWSLDIPGMSHDIISQSYTLGCTSALFLAQSIIASNVQTALSVLTRGTQPAGRVMQPLCVHAAPVWGLLQVFGLEHPDLLGAIIDLGFVPDKHEPTAVMYDLFASHSLQNTTAAATLISSHEDRVAIRGDRRYVPRLVHSARVSPATPTTIQLNAAGTYLVTGGLGALGLAVSQWLVQRGAGRLVITSRSGMPRATAEEDSRVAAIQSMRSQGAQVEVLRADVTNFDEMEAVIEQSNTAQQPLRGVIHAAGVLSFVPIAKLTEQELRKVMDSKVSGTWNLHPLTLPFGNEVEIFVMYS